MDAAAIEAMMAQIPKPKNFWQKHFGTDMLVASWLFILFSVEYLAVAILYLYDGYNNFTDDTASDWTSYVFYYWAQLIAALGYLVGSCFFLTFSYPESFSEMFKISEETISNMTPLEKYVTGTSFLQGLWYFILSSLPYVVACVFAMIQEPSSYFGYMMLGVCVVMFSIMGIWLVACFPENMIANNGIGSSHVYDKFLSKVCGGCDSFFKVHAASDFLVGSWLFTMVSALGAVGTLGFIADEPSNPLPWLLFTMSLGFTVGTYLFAYTAYPENMFPPTTMVWDACLARCCGVKEDRGGGGGGVDVERPSDENTPLKEGYSAGEEGATSASNAAAAAAAPKEE